ncbi:MAG: VWA domain-containing protein [Nitrospirae bacterium]|nr:VWA domain-containing protein [Nitrospirota bacterium]
MKRLSGTEIKAVNAERNLPGLSALALAVVLWLCPLHYAFGEAPSKDDTGTEVMFVVETSAAAAQADPEGLISHALKLSAALLTQDDGFGLITFNEKNVIVAGKITPAEKKPPIYKLIDSIGQFSSDNTTAINPYNALASAIREFPKEDISGANRVVVFINASKTYSVSPDENKKIRIAILNELIPLFKDKGIRLFTVSLGAEADRDFMEELSRKTGGFSYQCPQAASLNATAAWIYETLKSPDILPEDAGRFVVDESIDQLTLVLSKKMPETKLILQSPEGDKYNAGKVSAGMSWTQFYNFDIITISVPLPGEWQFTSIDEASNYIYISSQIKIRTNIKSSYQRVYQQMNVNAWLMFDDQIVDIRDLADAMGIAGTMTGPDDDTTVERISLKAEKKVEKVEKDKKQDKKQGKKQDAKDKKHDTKAEKQDNSEKKQDNGGIFTGAITPKAMGNYKLTISVRSKAIERSKSFFIAAIEGQSSQKANPDATENHPVSAKQSKVTSKVTSWLSNKYVSHSPSALNKSLKWFTVINIVLFLSILLYINRAKFIKAK